MILQVGCGNRQPNKDSIGIDLSFPSWCKKYPTRFIRGDVKLLPFKNETFDGVIGKHIFEHFSRFNDEREYVLKEWERVIKPKGFLKIVVPNSECYARLLLNKTWNIDRFSFMMFGSQTNEGQFHYVAYNGDSLCKYIKKVLGKEWILEDLSYGGGYMGFSKFKDFEIRTVFRKK